MDFVVIKIGAMHFAKQLSIAQYMWFVAIGMSIVIITLGTLPVYVEAADAGCFYISATGGFVLTQNNYNVAYLYDATYQGYRTTIEATADCSQCSDPISGLRTRQIFFASASDMELDSGIFASGEFGANVTEAFTVGVQVSFLNKQENADNDSRVTIKSNILTLMLDVSYMLFCDSSEFVEPYVSVGLGIARYSGNGRFIVFAANSVRDLNSVPSTLTAQGVFDPLVGISMAAQTKIGLLFRVGDDAAIDCGIRYLVMDRITNFGDWANNIVESDFVIQDPGAAQNPGSAGCNGRTGAGCGGPETSAMQGVPITTVPNSLLMSELESSNVIFDIGVRFFF